ncbi:MAG TPA: riboflavin synthase [Burkholderiales bacterium]|nr:riboflavin synthase [Burkholderiales bacterium]
MFTGIVEAVGKIVRVHPLEVECPALGPDDIAVGDSICVQGVCLTVTAITPHGFTADVSGETLRVTSGLDRPGEVNLEKALAMGERVGGHLVTGHVDGVGEVLQFAGGLLQVRAPRDLKRYIAGKGSICLDGVSLTVNRVEGDVFEVNLVPHTLQVTTLARLAPGAKVNLEVDLIARYVHQVLSEMENARIRGRSRRITRREQN